MFLCLLIAFVWTKPCAAQKSKTDSLISALNHHKNADTIRIDLLNKISNSLLISDFKRGLLYNDTALNLAQKLGSKPRLAETYLTRAKCMSSKNDFKAAMVLANEALKLFTAQKKRDKIAECYLALSSNNYALANYATALAFSNKALQIAYTTGNKLLIARCLNLAGINYGYLARYTEAINCHLKQLKIYEGLHDKHGISMALGNIGFVYYGLKNYPDAIKYTQQCLTILKQADDKINAAAALNNIGGFYLEMGDFKKAIAYNEEALTYNKIVNSRKGTANDLMDIGVACFNLHQYKQSVFYLNRSIAIYDSLGAKNNLSASLGHLAALYANTPANELLKAGISPINRYDKALKLQCEAVKLAQQTNDKSNESTQWQKLSAIYTQQKKYKEALESYQKHIMVRDSIVNDKKKQEIARLSMQYDFDKKEASIRLTNEKKQALAFIRNRQAEIHAQCIYRYWCSCDYFSGANLPVL